MKQKIILDNIHELQAIKMFHFIQSRGLLKEFIEWNDAHRGILWD